MSELQVLSIELKNVKCVQGATLNFRRREAGAGQLITLLADNGKGKTSILDGISAIFTGGSQPELIRMGADKMEARMFLSDGVKVSRSQTFKGSTLKIETEDGMPVKAPQSYIEKLASGFGFDPIAFDQADKKTRLNFLLQVMPLGFSPDEIGKALGDAGKLVQAPGGLLDISQLGRFVKELIERRAVIGSRRDEKSSSVEALRKTLLQSDSADDPKDWKTEAGLLKKRRDDLDGFETSDIDEVSSQAKEARQVKSAEYQKADDDVRSAFVLLLESARAGKSEEFETSPIEQGLKSLSAIASYLAKIDAAERDSIQSIREKNALEREEISRKLAEAEAGAESQTRSRAVREEMDKFRAQCNALTAEYDAIAKAVKDLEGLKRSKLDDLPVSGLEVRDGDIFVNGIQWDQLNQAKRWLKSIEIGSQGLGGLGLMVCDAAEHLGPTNWKDFEAAVIESGMTVVAARVASSEEIVEHGPELRSEPAGALAVV